MFCLVNKKRKRKKKVLGTFGNNLLISYLSFWKYSKVFLWIIDKLNPVRNQSYLGDIIFETRLWKSLQYFFFLFHQFYCSIIYMQCMGAKLLQSCPTLRNPLNCNLPGSSVHGILQEESWSGLPLPPPGDLPDPGDERVPLTSPALAGGFFTTSATWEASYMQWNSVNILMRLDECMLSCV